MIEFEAGRQTALFARTAADRRAWAATMPGVTMTGVTMTGARHLPSSPAALRTGEAGMADGIRADDIRDSLAEGRRRHAANRVEELKEQVRKLSILGMIDPAAFARLVSDIAGQLSAAVAAYADAGPSPDMRREAAVRPGGRETDRQLQAGRYRDAGPEWVADRRFLTAVEELAQQLDLLFRSAMAREDDLADDPGASGDVAERHGRAIAAVRASASFIAGWQHHRPARPDLVRLPALA